MKTAMITALLMALVGMASGQTLRCQFTNETLMPVATVCYDNLTVCATIFGVAETGSVRPALCDVTSLQPLALQCARTCAICCELPQYACNDDTTGVIACASNVDKCTSSSWLTVMAQYCPQTCGLCNQGTCRDLNSGCSSLISLCQNVNYYSYMQANCARTCGICSSTTCSDTASNCASITSLCSNSAYLSLMQTNCRRTCGYCSSTSSTTTCTNANSNCATWVANGFCTNSFYTAAVRQQYCAASCGLC